VVAGLPALFGFLILVAGHAVGMSLSDHYGWSDGALTAFALVRWPVSLLLIVFAVGLLFRYSPRRNQPALSWLLFGAALSTALWWMTSLALGGYVRISDGFGATYGSLTAIMALLLWANLTGISLFYGLAFAAQLEAQRVGVVRPALHDQWEPGPEESLKDFDPPPEKDGELPRQRDSGVSAEPKG
jgi:YihY family inner membrane protein